MATTEEKNSAGNSLPGPSPLPLAAMPCPECGSPFAWINAYGGASCSECLPPARPSMVRRRVMLVNNPSRGEVWEDYRTAGDQVAAASEQSEEEEKKFLPLRGGFRIATGRIFIRPLDWIPPGLSLDDWWNGEGKLMHDALLDAGESARIIREEERERAERAAARHPVGVAAAPVQAASRLDFDQPAKDPANSAGFVTDRKSPPATPAPTPKKKRGAGSKREPTPMEMSGLFGE